MIDARFGHVNVIANDWQKLADFYEAVFGMQIVPRRSQSSGPSGGRVSPASVRRAI